MSRKLLARDSGVSERYLAQLEAGLGNISILLLRQIASALNLPLTELLAEESDDAVELTLTTQFLKRLPRQKLAAVRLWRVLLRQRPDERMKRIALIGCAARKSRLGAGSPALGALCRARPRSSAKRAPSLRDLSALRQAGYRRYERLPRKVLEKRARRDRCGRQTVSEPGAYERSLRLLHGLAQSQPEEHMARVMLGRRPMVGNDQAMEDLRRSEGRAALDRRCQLDTAGRPGAESPALARLLPSSIRRVPWAQFSKRNLSFLVTYDRTRTATAIGALRSTAGRRRCPWTWTRTRA
jgi:XRE family aerobic/anaerobic benzoate catabolism transcriptional regulator